MPRALWATGRVAGRAAWRPGGRAPMPQGRPTL